ncbi:hypothetical protein TWF506_011415 [Arthrobotrys conoides]|uniref:Uncharacterized protein n=1 Tax=Arthrobotrys conoides TaxID=74498 RepID=A0AAN8RVL1_9PEZI
MDCRRDPTTGEPIGSIVYDKPSEVPEWLILNLLPLGAIGFGNVAKVVAMIRRIMEEEGHGVCEAVIRGVKLFGVTDPQTIEKIRCAGSPTITTATTTTTITNTTTTTTTTKPITKPATRATRATTTTANTNTNTKITSTWAPRASVKPIARASDKPAVTAACQPATAVSAPPAYILAPLARLRGGAKPRPHERWMLKYLEGEGGRKKEEDEEKEKEKKKEETGGEEVLGPDKTEPLVARAVERAYVPPHLRHKLPAWFLARASSSQ